MIWFFDLWDYRLRYFNPQSKTWKQIKGIDDKNCTDANSVNDFELLGGWNRENNVLDAIILEDAIWLFTNEGIYVCKDNDWILSGVNIGINDTIQAAIPAETKHRYWFIGKEKLILFDAKKIKILSQFVLPNKLEISRFGKLIATHWNDQLLIAHKDKKLIHRFSISKATWLPNIELEGLVVDIQKVANGLMIASTDKIWRLSPGKLNQFLEAKDLGIQRITCITNQGDSSLWIGTELGLHNYNLYNGVIRSYNANPNDKNALPDNLIYALDYSQKMGLWVGTKKGIAQYFSPLDGFKTFTENDRNGLATNFGLALIEDSNGRLWHSGYKGNLSVYHPVTGQIKNYYHKVWAENSLEAGKGDSPIPALYESKSGDIWVGGKCLSLYRPESDDFINYLPDKASSFGQIQSLIEDEDGNIWMGTNGGIYIFDPDTEYFSFLGLERNLQGLNFSRAVCEFPDGRLGFGGEKGIHLVDPSILYSAFTLPKLFIFRFFAGEDLYIERPDPNERLQLKAYQNNISFDIGMIQQSGGEALRYRLIGHDKDWNYFNSFTHQKVKYDNLSPNFYQIVIQFKDVRGNWVDEQFSMLFEVQKPFYLNNWFIIAESILAIIMLWILFVWITQRSLKRRERDLQLKFLQVKSLQSQMNPHFVFNVLGSMQNLILNRDIQKANESLVKLSTLIRRFLDSTVSMEFSNAPGVTREIPLEEEEELLRMYIEFEQLQYKGSFTYKLEIDPLINAANFTLPPMIIQPYVENAIKHGLLYRNDLDGWLQVNFSLSNNDALICTVMDNGVGRAQARLIQQQSFKKYKSHGTNLVNRRIEILNELDYDIQIETKDRLEGGTIVQIKIDKQYDN